MLSGCLLTVNAQQQVDIYTYDTLPPYAYRDERGRLTGLYVEIVRQAVAQMPDFTVDFKVVPWARAKWLAKQGLAFAILPPYFHAHDWLTDSQPARPYLWPYSLPLFTQRDVVICNTEKIRNTMRYPMDYQGLNFVMWRGDGREGELFETMVARKLIRVQYVESIKSVVKLLFHDRADCTVTAAGPFMWYWHQQLRFAASQKVEQTTKAISLRAVTIAKNEGYLAYTDVQDEQHFPFKADFVRQFDIAVYKLKRSGEWQQIIERFVAHELPDTFLLQVTGMDRKEE